MPLSWSEEHQPNDACRYNHVVSETPLGRLTIEWKGWKDHDSAICELPWGAMIIGIDVADAKASVQAAWNAMAASMSALTS